MRYTEREQDVDYRNAAWDLGCTCPVLPAGTHLPSCPLLPGVEKPLPGYIKLKNGTVVGGNIDGLIEYLDHLDEEHQDDA